MRASTRFLKHGELTDLFESLTFENIIPLLDVARDNFRLAEYLVGQVPAEFEPAVRDPQAVLPARSEEGLERGTWPDSAWRP